MKAVIRYSCSIAILLWSTFFFAQEKEEKTRLIDLIIQLERQHNLTFNYATAHVEDIFVFPPESTISISEKLAFISAQTSLIFSTLGDKFITITKREEWQFCGTVKDHDTGEPLQGATVKYNQQVLITNADGNFNLIPKQPINHLTIQYLGYNTLTLSLDTSASKPCVDILMQARLEPLNQVFLTSYLVKGIDKMKNGAFKVDFDEFSALPGVIETDVLQTIQALPGVQSLNETVSNINIRGGTNDQNLVLWDGIKMYQTGHFFGLISAFNPEATQTVLVQKNGTEASLSDGVSGVIHLKTDEQLNRKRQTTIGLNLTDANIFLDLPLGNQSSLQLGGRKSLSDITTTPTYTSYFDRISQDTEVESNDAMIVNSDKKFNFYDLSLRWLYKLSAKDHLRVNFLNIHNKLEFDEMATNNTTANSRRSSVAQSSLGFGFFYKREWNKSLSSSLEIYESDYKLQAINANILNDQRFLQENRVSETGAKLQATYALNDQQDLTIGSGVIETKVSNLDDVDKPLVRVLIAEVVRTASVFGQYQWQSKNQHSLLSTGLRYNYLEKFNESILEPRFRFSQKFLEHFSAEIAGEMKHQITSQIINFQNDFLGIEKRRWQLANDATIPITKSKQFSAGINFSKMGWLINIDGYYKNIDGINSQAQGFQNQFEFSKTDGSYRVLGADVLIRKRIETVTLWLSYAFMNNEYTFKNLTNQSFPSNYNIPHAITFGSTYVKDGLKLTAGFQWRSGNPTTKPILGSEIIDNQIQYGSINASRLKNYFRVDASALYAFDLKKTQIETGISVLNILNQENEIGSYYRIDSEGAIKENIQNALGFTPNAMMRISF